MEEAQRLLQAAGYDVSQTGEADAQTLSLLFDAQAETSLRTPAAWQPGGRVRQLQNRLIDLKLLVDDATASTARTPKPPCGSLSSA